MSGDLPLPYGWVQEFDPRTDHPYYVDTKATPPRAIWVSPYEDEQFLAEHPDIKEKVGRLDHNQDGKPSPPATERPRRHSYHGESSANPQGAKQPDAASHSGSTDKKRGFFGRMKDKAIGTKEEREAERKQMLAVRGSACKISNISNEVTEQLDERRRQQRAEQRAEQLRRIQEMRAQNPQMDMGYSRQMGFGGYPGSYGEYSGSYGPARYGPPMGYPQQSRFGGGGFGGGGFGGDGFSGRRGRGGLGLPLLGGLAGGLLLGDVLDGGFDGGGFGGGGFDGGGGFL